MTNTNTGIAGCCEEANTYCLLCWSCNRKNMDDETIKIWMNLEKINELKQENERIKDSWIEKGTYVR